MLRRFSTSSRRTAAVVLSSRLSGHSHPSPAAYAAVVTPEDLTSTPKVHERSGFEYKASIKGDEVGARNEAAFVGYKQFEPTALKQRYAVPHEVNLLTVLPILLVIALGTAESYGIVLWELYCRTHYSTVVIERPE